MQCPSCNASLKEGSKFCEHCGSALPRVCLACGHANSAQARFCSECGAGLVPGKPSLAASTGPRPTPTATPASSAERRQLTIMFCDMVGSSALSTRLDPEEQRDVVSAFQSFCAAEIKDLGGMVAQYLGDGVLAYFGYPAAHEDDAERAVRAGLAILEVVGTLKPATNVTLQARIGIASGIVVVGDLVRAGVTQENAAIGETTNLAARLQSLAEPNTMVIAPETHRLVGALFEYRDLGSQTLKGFGEPLHVRQVIKPSKIENRFEVRRAAMGSRLLGRDEELDLLWRRWEQAKRGEGRVVLVTGEPGIGKSRLTRALQERLRSEPYTQLLYHCSPYHQDSALYPIISQLIRAAGIERDDAPEITSSKCCCGNRAKTPQKTCHCLRRCYQSLAATATPCRRSRLSA
jgi:class 3 adenylate cyclase